MVKKRADLLRIILLLVIVLLALGLIFYRLHRINDYEEKEYLFENFRVIENKEELIIYDKAGEPIFIIEKD